MKRKVGDWIEGFLRFTENSEPPTTFRRWVAVSVIAAALQRKTVLRWGYLNFYPNMYIVIVGPSGKTRKGTAMTPGYNLLRDMGIKVAAEAITREALIRELRKASDTTIGKDNRPILHSSLTIYSQELTVFLGYKNMQLISDLTDWYDCRDRWTYRTKNMGTDEIIGVWVNLIGATTPELIQSSLPRDAIGGGLTSRIIFIYEENKEKIVPTPFLTSEQVSLYSDLLEDLQNIYLMTGDFKVTEDFIDRWVDWYTQHNREGMFGNTKELQGYVERRPNHLLKLSMILSASRSSDMLITRGDFEKALSMLEEVERNMPKVFAGVGQSPMSEVMNNMMQYIAIRKEVALDEMLEYFYRDVGDKDTLMRIVNTLEMMRYIVVVRTKDRIYIKHRRSEDEGTIIGKIEE